MISLEQLARSIEHTCLKPSATLFDIHKLCEEAHEWNFYGVCIAPIWLTEARPYLRPGSTRLITVAGFPTGAHSTLIKCREVEEAIDAKADEIDFVLNIGWLKEQRFHAIENEFKQLVSVASATPLKVIMETCFLTDKEKEWICQTAIGEGISFVKTSTGFGTHGASVEDVRLLKGWFPYVKASGGIKDLSMAIALIEAGASRLGTSSGCAIMEAYKEQMLDKLEFKK